MSFQQTTLDKATIFPTIILARDTAMKAAAKWQQHFMICAAEAPQRGFTVRLANGQYLRTQTD